MAHPIVHIELSANNHQEAARWYGELFGWELKDWPEMKYTTFQSGEKGPGGGFMNVQEGFPAGTVLVYISSDDLEADMDRVAAHGGTVIMRREEVPTVGAIGWFKDPTGNLMALIQPTMVP